MLAACGGSIEVPVPRDAGSGGGGSVQVPPDDAAVMDAPVVVLPDGDPCGGVQCNPGIAPMCAEDSQCPESTDCCKFSCNDAGHCQANQ